MPDQMHGKFKALLSKVEKTRRNIEEMNIWAIPKSHYKWQLNDKNLYVNYKQK
jgi:hypothetical protein